MGMFCDVKYQNSLQIKVHNVEVKKKFLGLLYKCKRVHKRQITFKNFAKAIRQISKFSKNKIQIGTDKITLPAIKTNAKEYIKCKIISKMTKTINIQITCIRQKKKSQK